MTDSRLKLNANKTDFLIIGAQKQRGKLDCFSPDTYVSARNLGVSFDNNLNFRQHISQTCLCCFYHIRDLRRIRRYMYFAVAKLLQLLRLAADLTTAIPFIIILLSRTS